MLLSGKSHLPAETVAYVRLVTGWPVSEWISTPPPTLDRTEIPQAVPCTSLADLNPIGRFEQNQSSKSQVSAWAAWGVQLLGDFTQDRVLARYENLRRKYSHHEWRVGAHQEII